MDKLFSQKRNDFNSETTELESQIDKLYSLTEGEIKIVEENVKQGCNVLKGHINSAQGNAWGYYKQYKFRPERAG